MTSRSRLNVWALPVLAVLVAAVMLLLPRGETQQAEAHPGPALDPTSVNATIGPNGTHNVIKTVHTPALAPVVDIYFLADTTGSMGPTLAAVQASAAGIIAAVDAAAADPRYGAGDYKDFPGDAYAFNNAAPFPAADDNGAAASAAIAAWAAGGGNDAPEGQFYALHRIANHGVAGYRAAASKFVVWFGDAPGHDPVCTAISGDAHAITEASLTAELVAAGIKVVAISVPSGAGLDADPAPLGNDYVAACGAPGGAAGQATRIAAATGGSIATGVTPAGIAAAILAGLTGGNVTVSMTSDCATKHPGIISTTFAPPSQIVAAGTHAVFTETIGVGPGVAAGSVFECDDWALIDGNPMRDAAGEIIKEHKVITVGANPDLTVTKRLKPGQPAASVGGKLYYLVHVTNVGNVATPKPPATVTLVDTPPAGTNVLAWSIIKGSGKCALNGAGQLVCDLGANFAPGAETIVEVVIRTPAAGTLTNTAEVDPHKRIAESNEGNNAVKLDTVIP